MVYGYALRRRKCFKYECPSQFESFESFEKAFVMMDLGMLVHTFEYTSICLSFFL